MAYLALVSCELLQNDFTKIILNFLKPFHIKKEKEEEMYRKDIALQ